MSGQGWPVWPKPKLSEGSFEWVTCKHGRIPDDAIPAGRDNSGYALYAGRAHHEGEVLPAMVSEAKKCAFVTWRGRTYKKEEGEFQILVSEDIAWKYAHDEKYIHPQAMVVGYSDCEEVLYMGRAYYKNSFKLGKIQPRSRCVCIPFEGKEIAFSEVYEIMVLL